VYVCPGSVEGTRTLLNGPYEIVPENVRITHCPGATTNCLLPIPPKPKMPKAICPVVHPPLVVEDVVVVVDLVDELVPDPEVEVGTKTI
jgi:hypothetical protein